MAISYVINDNNVIGNKRANTVTITFDSSYPTGGESVSAAGCGLFSITAIMPMYPGVEFVQSSGKLRVRGAAIHNHDLLLKANAAANAVSVADAGATMNSAMNADITVAGGSATVGGVQNTASGNQVIGTTGSLEVPNTTDLSGLVVTCLVYGS